MKRPTKAPGEGFSSSDSAQYIDGYISQINKFLKALKLPISERQQRIKEIETDYSHFPAKFRVIQTGA